MVMNGKNSPSKWSFLLFDIFGLFCDVCQIENFECLILES
jgi:hypothetical protein